MFAYFENLLGLFIDMSFYMLIGLLFTGFLHAFIKESWVKNQLGGKSVKSSLKAALVGVPLPLCSCGVVPMAVYLREKGASKGAVMSFLTSTPQTGIDSLIASYGMLGPIFAVYRAVAAFISGVITGFFTEIFDKGEAPEPKPAEPASKSSCCCHSHKAPQPQKLSFIQKVKEMLRFAFIEFLDKITKNFLIGLLVAAAIATLLPADLLSQIQNPLVGMMLVLVIGIPMYVCSTASIPIALALMVKGLSPGAAFVFLFAGPATNAASLAVLLKAFSKKSILIYLASLSCCALAFGYVLDVLWGDAVKAELSAIQDCCDSPIKIAGAVLFAFLLVMSLFRMRSRTRVA